LLEPYVATRSNDGIPSLAAIWRLPLAVGVAALNLLLSPLRTVLSATGQAGSPGTPGNAPPAPSSTQTGPETDVVRDTINGLIAFVVPGSDAYSVAQGMSTAEFGGLDAGITDALIASIDLGQPHPPQGPLPSASAASLLNQVASKLAPLAPGNFVSPFARLSFSQKTAVFQFLEQDPSMVPFRRVAALLLFIPAAATYSEGGAFDLSIRTVVGWPVGWTLSGYSGVANGRDEFKGYFQGRREAAGTGNDA
jgi:hypothetical protein